MRGSRHVTIGDNLNAPPDEEELKLLLVGTQEESSRAIARVHELYAPKILNFLKKEYPGLSRERVEEALLDTFLGLFEAVSENRFDLDPPLGAFLFTVAKRRAIDQLRQQRRLVTNTKFLLENTGEYLECTDVGKAWGVVVGRDKANEIRGLFLEFLSSLPARQRQVAEVMAEGFPEKLDSARAIDLIYERTGERLTAVMIKSALSQIREKFRTLLNERGV